MNQQKLEKFHRQLEVLQDRLRDDGSAVTEQARSLGGSGPTGELSHAPLHLGDRGSEEYLQDMNEVLAENEGYLAGEVRAALARIEDGSFGICADCGKAIVKERLEAIPFVRQCVKCAEIQNGSARGDFAAPNFETGRPHGPKDTLAPEGEMDESGRRAGHRSDIYAAGDAGGGTEFGGLAGSNSGNGEPDVAEIQAATGSGVGEVPAAVSNRRPTTVEPIAYENTDELEEDEEEEED